MGDVRDVHAQHAVARLVHLQRERVVVVARRLGIAGEDEFPTQIQASVQWTLRTAGGLCRSLGYHTHTLGLGNHLWWKFLGELVLLHHRKRVEGRIVSRTDHVRDLALRGETRVLPTNESHHHTVIELRAMRVGHEKLLAIGRRERLHARKASQRNDGPDNRPRRTRVNADDTPLGSALAAIPSP